MSATSGAHLVRHIMLPLTVLSVALTGCAGSSQPSQSTSAPSSPVQSQSSAPSSQTAAGGFCGEIGAQMESLNFFPLALSTESGGTASLREVEDLQAGAPSSIQDRLVELKKTMEKGVKDPDAFNRQKFIEAKIQVENWIFSNC